MAQLIFLFTPLYRLNRFTTNIYYMYYNLNKYYNQLRRQALKIKESRHRNEALIEKNHIITALLKEFIQYCRILVTCFL